MFCRFVIGLPIAIVGAKGDFAVGIFQGKKVAGRSVCVVFEQVRDPVARVVAFYLYQQLEGELGGSDIVRDSQELAAIGIKGGQDHAVHFESDLCVIGTGVGRDQFGLLEVLAEISLDVVVAVSRVAREAAADACGEEQGCSESDGCECAFHIFKFCCY